MAASFWTLWSAAGWAQQIPSAQRAYDRGLQLEAQGRHKEAAQDFARAADINPEFEDAYFQLGNSSLKAGDTQSAIKAFIQLLQLDPKHEQAMLAAADCYVDLGMFEDSLPLYSRALQVDPKSGMVHYKLGRALFEKRDYPEAIDELKRSLALDGSNLTAQRLLASAYLANGNGEEARKQILDSIERNPKAPEPHGDLGDLLLRNRRTAEGEQEYTAALAVEPTYSPARLGLARIYRQNGDPKRAIDEITLVLAKDPDNTAAFLEKGQCEYALGSRDLAARDFAEFIRREPNSPEGEYLLGLLDLTTSRLPSAVEHLQRAIQIDPTLADAHYYLAEALHKSRRDSEARSALARCLDLDPANARAIALRADLK